MAIVQVSFYATVSNMNFLTVERATAAYRKIATALSEYRMFKNDRAETVEVETDGGICTIKLERVDSVIIDNGSESEAHLRDRLEFEVKTRAMRAELGLPDMPPVNPNQK